MKKNENDNDFIRTLRFYGISKRELGTTLKLSQPTVKSYCENPSKFRYDQIKKIGQMTGLSNEKLDELISNGKKV